MFRADGTKNKKKIGANAILAVSVATARAVADGRKIPLYKYIAEIYGIKNPHILPRPMMNILNGGVHADNNLTVQEFMIIPTAAKSEFDAVRIGSEIFHHLKKILKERGFSTAVGDEGGFAPNLGNSVTAMDMIISAIKSAGYKPGKQVYLGLDIAASEFYKNGIYKFENQKLKSNDMLEIYSDWLKKYPIISIEDGLAENDWGGWAEMTEKFGRKIQIVGDDLFTTNPIRLKRGIKHGVANAILIKPNQIGTLTETLCAVKIARDAKYGVIISHRSGETADTFIADLAVGTNAGQIKTGSLSRGERTEKYNRLIRIQDELGKTAKYGIK